MTTFLIKNDSEKNIPKGGNYTAGTHTEIIVICIVNWHSMFLLYFFKQKLLALELKDLIAEALTFSKTTSVKQM